MLSSCLRLILDFCWENQEQVWTWRLILDLCITASYSYPNFIFVDFFADSQTPDAEANSAIPLQTQHRLVGRKLSGWGRWIKAFLLVLKLFHTPVAGFCHFGGSVTHDDAALFRRIWKSSLRSKPVFQSVSQQRTIHSRFVLSKNEFIHSCKLLKSRWWGVLCIRTLPNR